MRRLQTFRLLHTCSGCFRLERIAGWGSHPLESAALSRRTANQLYQIVIVYLFRFCPAEPGRKTKARPSLTGRSSSPTPAAGRDAGGGHRVYYPPLRRRGKSAIAVFGLAVDLTDFI